MVLHVALVVLGNALGASSDAQNLAIRLHSLLTSNPDIASCTVLIAASCTGSSGDVNSSSRRQFLFDRRLVTKATLGGALRATIEPVTRRHEPALVVRIAETEGSEDSETTARMEAMASSYGVEIVRVLAGDDVLRDVLEVAAEITALLTSHGRGDDRGDDRGNDGVTLVATSRQRLVRLSPHLPLSKYLMFDVDRELDDVPSYVSSALVKASDFMVRMETSDGDDHRAIAPVFSAAFERFRLLTETRDIPWVDAIPAMSPVFDRNEMVATLGAIANAANAANASGGEGEGEGGTRMSVGTARSWPILGHDSDISDLVFPCLIKSRAACGVPDSHSMALVLREEGLDECEMPGQLLAQEFVNHGGVVFKVYVGTCGFDVLRRESLPDIDNVTDNMPSLIEFDSLHGLPTRLPWTTNMETGAAGEATEKTEEPDRDFFARLVSAARLVVGLSVFGFDVVVRRRGLDDPGPSEAILVDINYLPRLFDGAL